MKNILIPTDFSENAWNACRYALELLEQQDCFFYFLNTYTPAIRSSRLMATSSDDGMLEKGAKLSSKKGLQGWVGRIKKEFDNPKHQFKTISSFRLLATKVQEAVTELNIHLVVTGTKGASDFDEVFMGSNTVQIVKSVRDCPVLVIPQDFSFTALDEIAFTTDFNRFYTLSELQPLIDMAQSFNAVVRIVYMQDHLQELSELQQFNLNMMRKYFKDVKHCIDLVTETGTISKTLEVFIDDLDIHLLAMLNHQHSYVDGVTGVPMVKRESFHTKIPLLVLPELGMGGHTKGKMKSTRLTLPNAEVYP